MTATREGHGESSDHVTNVPGRIVAVLAGVPGRLAIASLRAYRLYSKRMPRVCIYRPSCSTYSELAIRRYGLWRALPMIRTRLRSCRGGAFVGEDHPGPGRSPPGGVDPTDPAGEGLPEEAAEIPPPSGNRSRS